MAAEAQRLIGVSLSKITQPRGRGGNGLHRSLLVATVLQKARYIFMEDAYRLARENFAAAEKKEERVPENRSDAREDGDGDGSIGESAPPAEDAGRGAGPKRPREDGEGGEGGGDSASKRLCGDASASLRITVSVAPSPEPGPRAPPPCPGPRASAPDFPTCRLDLRAAPAAARMQSVS